MQERQLPQVSNEQIPLASPTEKKKNTTHQDIRERSWLREIWSRNLLRGIGTEKDSKDTDE